MRVQARQLSLLLLLLALAACGPLPRARRGTAAPPPQTTVQVENRAWLDMNIFVIRGGHRVRLGMVPATSTRVFVIPANLVFGPTSLQFLADPVGSRRTPISHEIMVRPGDRLRLMIPN